MVFKENLIGIFINNDPEVFNLAVHGAKIYSLAFLISGLNVIFSGYFTSIGKALASIIVAGSRGIVFIIMGIIILPKFFGIDGVWATVPFSEILTLIIVVLLYKSINKKDID